MLTASSRSPTSATWAPCFSRNSRSSSLCVRTMTSTSGRSPLASARIARDSYAAGAVTSTSRPRSANVLASTSGRPGRAPADHQQPSLAQGHCVLAVRLDDDVRDAVSGELGGDGAADAAVADQHHVIAEALWIEPGWESCDGAGISLERLGHL